MTKNLTQIPPTLIRLADIHHAPRHEYADGEYAAE